MLSFCQSTLYRASYQFNVTKIEVRVRIEKKGTKLSLQEQFLLDFCWWIGMLSILLSILLIISVNFPGFSLQTGKPILNGFFLGNTKTGRKAAGFCFLRSVWHLLNSVQSLLFILNFYWNIVLYNVVLVSVLQQTAYQLYV